MGCENIIKLFFHMSNTIKLYHWQTTSFARHKATCELFNNLQPLIDDFIEVYMGRYERPSFSDGFKLNIKELSDDSALELVQEYADYLKNELPKYLKSSDTDLLNIRDEMLSNLNKVQYLFTLN
jgi:hypothetical protein